MTVLVSLNDAVSRVELSRGVGVGRFCAVAGVMVLLVPLRKRDDSKDPVGIKLR